MRCGRGCKFKGFDYTIRPPLKNFEGKVILTRLTNCLPISVDESIKRDDFEQFLKLVAGMPAPAGNELKAAKRAVEIALEQDEAAGMAYLASERALA